MGGQQESASSDSRVFGGAVPPVQQCETGAFLCGIFRFVGLGTNFCKFADRCLILAKKTRRFRGAFPEKMVPSRLRHSGARYLFAMVPAVAGQGRHEPAFAVECPDNEQFR
jgi:hypothetical protein